MATINVQAGVLKIVLLLLSLAAISGCATQAPCLQYDTRDVQITQYTRGYGSYTTTRTMSVCTARAEL